MQFRFLATREVQGSDNLNWQSVQPKKPVISLSRCWFFDLLSECAFFLVFFFFFLVCVWSCARAKVPAFSAQLSQFQKSWRERVRAAQQAHKPSTRCALEMKCDLWSKIPKRVSLSLPLLCLGLSLTKYTVLQFLLLLLPFLYLFVCVCAVERDGWSECSSRTLSLLQRSLLMFGCLLADIFP